MVCILFPGSLACYRLVTGSNELAILGPDLYPSLSTTFLFLHQSQWTFSHCSKLCHDPYNPEPLNKGYNLHTVWVRCLLSTSATHLISTMSFNAWHKPAQYAEHVFSVCLFSPKYIFNQFARLCMSLSFRVTNLNTLF